MVVLGEGAVYYERGTPVTGEQQAGADPRRAVPPRGMRVVHLGRSTWHAISGRGISQLGSSPRSSSTSPPPADPRRTGRGNIRLIRI